MWNHQKIKIHYKRIRHFKENTLSTIFQVFWHILSYSLISIFPTEGILFESTACHFLDPGLLDVELSTQIRQIQVLSTYFTPKYTINFAFFHSCPASLYSLVSICLPGRTLLSVAAELWSDPIALAVFSKLNFSNRRHFFGGPCLWRLPLSRLTICLRSQKKGT